MSVWPYLCVSWEVEARRGDGQKGSQWELRRQAWLGSLIS